MGISENFARTTVGNLSGANDPDEPRWCSDLHDYGSRLLLMHEAVGTIGLQGG